MRIGVDLGGTKIEALALAEDGAELLRYRIDTPKGDYDGTLGAIAGLVARLEAELGARATVGVGIPGTLRADGRVKNANSTWLNGRLLREDLGAALAREVRVANDANCLAVSEATDGAGKGKRVVFAVILGTGCGGGVALEGKVHGGPNGVTGEWGHTPLPWAVAAEWPGPECYCGRRGCLEMWVSGTGLERDYFLATGERRSGRAIAGSNSAEATAAMTRLENRLARGLATVVDVLDPDVIVIGGGLSRVSRIYENLPGLMREYVFGGDFATEILPALFGDSSGVRGAAWL